MDPEIWRDWLPGVLSGEQLSDLVGHGYVIGAHKDSIAPSSIDLHIGNTCYQLTQGSVKPFDKGFIEDIRQGNLAIQCPQADDGSWRLASKNSYLFEIEERLTGLRGTPIWGQATAKSSVGRVDVLARLVVDGMNHYERFAPDLVSEDAAMFLEVTPITFNVRVKPGASLNQLRFFYGNPRDCELSGKEVALTCLDAKEYNLTVDLTPAAIFDGLSGSGYRAAPVDRDNSVPLWKDTHEPDPAKWWEVVRTDSQGRLRIEVDKFYILRSKERLRVPPGIAVYARAIDEEIGEMRIHYAGFAHPCFGWERKDGKRGTPLIFEVRGHSVPVSLRHGEVLARLQFFRMSTNPARVVPSPYDDQELKLSSYFGSWRTRPRIAD